MGEELGSIAIITRKLASSLFFIVFLTFSIPFWLGSLNFWGNMLDNKLKIFSYKRLAVCYNSRRGKKLSNDLESEEDEEGVGIHCEESLGEHEDAATGYTAARMSG